MGGIITGIVCGAIAFGCVVLGITQLFCVGKPLNNEYLYASELERKNMNLKPLFRQSGVVFLLIGAIFSVNAVGCLLKNTTVFFLLIPTVTATFVFVIVSTIRLNKKK